MAWSGGWGGAYRPWGCCGGWYGGGYRRPVVINTGDINIGNSVNIGNRTTIRNNIDRNTNVNLDRSRTNIYNRTENRARDADRATAMGDLKQARPATNRANDVFADRDGNVARRAGDEWQTRQNGQWQPDTSGLQDRVTPASRDRVQSMPTRDLDRSSLNSAHSARQHGASRQMSMPTQMRAPMRRRR